MSALTSRHLELINFIIDRARAIDQLELRRKRNFYAALQRGLERLANMSEAERVAWLLGGSKK